MNNISNYVDCEACANVEQSAASACVCLPFIYERRCPACIVSMQFPGAPASTACACAHTQDSITRSQQDNSIESPSHFSTQANAPLLQCSTSCKITQHRSQHPGGKNQPQLTKPPTPTPKTFQLNHPSNKQTTSPKQTSCLDDPELCFDGIGSCEEHETDKEMSQPDDIDAQAEMELPDDLIGHEHRFVFEKDEQEQVYAYDICGNVLHQCPHSKLWYKCGDCWCIEHNQYLHDCTVCKRKNKYLPTRAFLLKLSFTPLLKKKTNTLVPLTCITALFLFLMKLLPWPKTNWAGIIKGVRTSKCRRTAPDFALPNEIWRMFLGIVQHKMDLVLLSQKQTQL
jgi:hypothetical protein